MQQVTLPRNRSQRKGIGERVSPGFAQPQDDRVGQSLRPRRRGGNAAQAIEPVLLDFTDELHVCSAARL